VTAPCDGVSTSKHKKAKCCCDNWVCKSDKDVTVKFPFLEDPNTCSTAPPYSADDDTARDKACCLPEANFDVVGLLLFEPIGDPPQRRPKVMAIVDTDEMVQQSALNNLACMCCTGKIAFTLPSASGVVPVTDWVFVCNPEAPGFMPGSASDIGNCDAPSAM